MAYVAAGYIATFGTIGMYAAWAVVQSRRAAANVMRRSDDAATTATTLAADADRPAR